MAQRQILQLIERAIDKLPNLYRIVFVARVIEGLSIEETANLLAVRPETVKTRLHRARPLRANPPTWRLPIAAIMPLPHAPEIPRPTLPGNPGRRDHPVAASSAWRFSVAVRSGDYGYPAQSAAVTTSGFKITLKGPCDLLGRVRP